MANSNDQDTSRPNNNTGQGQVKVLPPEERENFKGITIEVGDTSRQGQDDRGYYEYDYCDPQRRVYSRHVKLNSSLLNWLILGFLALIVIFIVLPFFYLFMPLLIPLFFFILISNLLRRR